MDFATSAKKVSSFCFHRGQQNTHINTLTHKAISIISLCCSDSTRTCINIQSCPSHLIYKNGNSHLCSTIKQLMTLFYYRKNKDNKRIWWGFEPEALLMLYFPSFNGGSAKCKSPFREIAGPKKLSTDTQQTVKVTLRNRFSPSG